MTSRSVAALLAAALAAPLGAQTEPPAFMMMWDATGDAVGQSFYDWNLYGNPPVYGEHSLPDQSTTWTGWKYEGSLVGQEAMWELSWTCIFDDRTAAGASAGAGGSAGAFVVASIVVTNNSSFTENFQSMSVLSLAETMSSPLMRGANEGILSDLNFNTAEVAAPTGGQIYTPGIDGVDEVAGFLMVDPFSETVGALGQATVGPESFGEPPLAASRDATSEISLLLSFDLSPGDSVRFDAYFELLPLPGPGGLPLLAAIGLLARRRRAR